MTTPVDKELCSKCGEPTPIKELNADNECEICAALMRLRDTMERLGKLHPDLFDSKRAALPPGDRE